MNYFIHLIVIFEIYLIVAASLNLLVGYTGLLQVAHAAYFGVGAYTSAILSSHGFGFLPCLLIATIAAGSLSLLISLPAGRFRGNAFLMTSLATQVTLYAVMYNWTKLTGGPFGLSGIPKPVIRSIRFATTGRIAALYGIIMMLVLALLAMIQASPMGSFLMAVRDDMQAARSLGLPARRLQMEAFLIATAFAGLAGGMYSFYMSYIDPSTFTIDESVLMLSMVIIGGTGNIRGPLIGVLLLILIPECLRWLHLPSSLAANVRLMAYGLLLVIFMLWRPQGIAGRYRFE